MCLGKLRNHGSRSRSSQRRQSVCFPSLTLLEIILTPFNSGGRGDFKWEDVRDSQHRENYLGHSLMAPVGRWQKNKDLSWYAKNDTSEAANAAAEARREEIKRVKQAESDALSKALGYEPIDRSEGNANDTPIRQKDVEKAIKETADGDDEAGAKGVGFGGFVGASGPVEEGREVLGGIGFDANQRPIVQERRRNGEERREKRRRSRSRDRSRERRHRRHTHGESRSHRTHHSRDRERRGARSRSRDRNHHRSERSRSYERRRERSHSPYVPKRRGYSRERDYDYRRR